MSRAKEWARRPRPKLYPKVPTSRKVRGLPEIVRLEEEEKSSAELGRLKAEVQRLNSTIRSLQRKEQNLCSHIAWLEHQKRELNVSREKVISAREQGLTQISSQTSDHDLHQKQEEGMLHMGKKDRDLYLRKFVTSPRAISSAHMAELADRYSMVRDLDKQRVVEHDQLIQEFEWLTTDTDGLLGVLEDTLTEYGDDANFEAKKLLCALFQESYDRCREAVIHHISAQLESLFVNQSKKTEEMDDATRGYGLLLHAFGLRTEEMRANIKADIYHEILKGETLRKVRRTLESSHEDHLGKVIELTWKFVTLPNPLIVCQPKEFDPKIHDPESLYWNKQAKEFELIYIRPVVYRNYEGVVARKGWVANTSQQRSKWSDQEQKQTFTSLEEVDGTTVLGLESVDNTTVLGEDDLRDVRSAVADLAGRWEDLGISLGVRPGDLEAILSASAHSPSSCLKKMLVLWLRQSYDVERFGKPTWRRLVEAVADHVGGNNCAVAQAIAAEHPVTFHDREFDLFSLLTTKHPMPKKGHKHSSIKLSYGLVEPPRSGRKKKRKQKLGDKQQEEA